MVLGVALGSEVFKLSEAEGVQVTRIEVYQTRAAAAKKSRHSTNTVFDDAMSGGRVLQEIRNQIQRARIVTEVMMRIQNRYFRLKNRIYSIESVLKKQITAMR